MRACLQCGLSIGESATFCPVCGARSGVDGDGAIRAPLEAVVAPPGPPQDPESAAGLEAAPVTGHSAIPDAEPETGVVELVANLAAEHGAAAAALEPAATAEDEAILTVELEEGVAVAPEPEPEADAEQGPEAADATAPEANAAPEPGDAVSAAQPAEPAEPPQDGQDRKMAEIADLLELASRCEEADPSRAAAVYGEAVVACLEATGDPLGSAPVRRGLLRGFDRLSFILERQGLPQEALAVVDDAAALGLLDGGDDESAVSRASLAGRREGLRRSLRGHPAQV